MQTFLPYPDVTASAEVLDSRRLGKQRVEAFQILRALTVEGYAWKSHPAVRMWRGFVPGLVAYGLATAQEWVRRGFADTTEASLLGFTDGWRPDMAQLHRTGQLPPWWGSEAFHLSHRSALVRKDPGHYRPLFPDVPDDLPYVWPAAAFPRWPVRKGERGPLTWPSALAELGFTAARDGQAAAVRCLVAGHSVLLCMAPGSGGTSTGLLAGLSVAGATLWVLPPAAVAPAPLGVAPRSGATPRPRAAGLGWACPEPEFAFLPAPWAAPGPGTGLMVLDRPGPAQRAVAARHPGLPALVISGPLAPAARTALLSQLGRPGACQHGGGFDLPRTIVVADPGLARAGPAARRRIVAELSVRAGLVLTRDRAAGERLALRLSTEGVRCAVVGPAVRPARTAEAARAWRSRRLEALIAPVGFGLDDVLGRVEAPLVIVATRRAAPDLLGDLASAGHRGGDVRAVVAGWDEPAGGRSSGSPPVGCRWRALLDHLGQTPPAPCDRCDVCSPWLARPEPAVVTGGGGS